MNKVFRKNIAMLAVGAVSSAGLASAQSVNYTYTGETGGGLTMNISTTDYTGNAQIGQFIMTSTTPGFTSPLLSYCTDVGVALAGTYNYTPTPLASATGVSPAWISGGIQNAATLWYDDKGAATTAVQTAGLQLAIWELLYNKVGTSYSASTFYNSANSGFHLLSTDSNSEAAANYAAVVLNGFSGLPSGSQFVEWLAPTEANGTVGGSQGLFAVTPSTQSLPSVPDAGSTLALLGSATALLAAARRKMK
jgi:hypothetical protein